jgi:N-acetylneuraminate synthase/N,N'-diacetyllegionaminate synthase
MPAALALTGAVYVASAGDLLRGEGFYQPGRTRGVALGRERAVDVDEPADLVVAEALASAAPASPVFVGPRAIGPGHPCFIIAEAGVNHDGDVGEAHRLIDGAADAGADAVKFQTWQTELLCRPGAPTADYQRDNAGQTDQFAMLKALELPYAAHAELKAHAEARGLVFLSTPDEIVSARFLVGLGVDAIKIGSGEVDNLLYLSQLARMGKPLLLSTGMADMPEVAAAVDTILAHGAPPFVLFHTLSNYPAPVDQMNVRAVETLRRAFGVPVGLSDHTLGAEAIMVAVGVGVDLWEKHITMDRGRAGPDHLASLEPGEFRRQVEMLRDGEKARGDGQKRAQPAEMATRRVVRKRLFAARPIAAGARLGPDDVVALRADDGLSAARWPEVDGRVTTGPIAEGAPLSLETLAPRPDPDEREASGR